MPTGQYTAADVSDDFTDKYNTPIPSGRQAAYEQWARANGQDPVKGKYDYDLQGAYLANSGSGERGHFTDQFKKPNHTTFSDQSQYHGLDGYTGGTWGDPKPGETQGTFQPSQTNLGFNSQDQLQSYFNKVEPGTRLLPAQPVPQPTGRRGQYTYADLAGNPAPVAPPSPMNQLTNALGNVLLPGQPKQ